MNTNPLRRLARTVVSSEQRVTRPTPSPRAQHRIEAQATVQRLSMMR